VPAVSLPTQPQAGPRTLVELFGDAIGDRAKWRRLLGLLVIPPIFVGTFVLIALAIVKDDIGPFWHAVTSHAVPAGIWTAGCVVVTYVGSIIKGRVVGEKCDHQDHKTPPGVGQS
jgi:hypothetical protein